jgi:hypothetical protein
MARARRERPRREAAKKVRASAGRARGVGWAAGEGGVASRERTKEPAATPA